MAKILVIDDDSRDRELLATVLEERGYEVTVADNGGTGLMLCHRQNPTHYLPAHSPLSVFD